MDLPARSRACRRMLVLRRLLGVVSLVVGAGVGMGWERREGIEGGMEKGGGKEKRGKGGG